MPKNAAWQNAVTTRAAISSPYPGASAQSALPITKSPIRPISARFLGRRAVSTARMGAPIVTPIA